MSKNFIQNCVLARLNEELDETSIELKVKDTKIQKLQAVL